MLRQRHVILKQNHIFMRPKREPQNNDKQLQRNCKKRVCSFFANYKKLQRNCKNVFVVLLQFRLFPKVRVYKFGYFFIKMGDQIRQKK